MEAFGETSATEIILINIKIFLCGSVSTMSTTYFVNSWYNILSFLAPGALDVGIVLDSSEDVAPEDWNRLKDFTKEFVKRFPNVSPAPDGTRFGVISYATRPAVHFNFRALSGNRLNPTEVQALVDQVPRPPGSKRRIDSALQLAETDLFSPKGGARKGAKRVNLSDYVLFDILNFNGIASMSFYTNEIYFYFNLIWFTFARFGFPSLQVS